MIQLFAYSGDLDQMSHSAASDLGLHCLQIALLGVSRPQWVNNDQQNSLFGTFLFAAAICIA